jgi:hypothetical protein
VVNDLMFLAFVNRDTKSQGKKMKQLTAKGCGDPKSQQTSLLSANIFYFCVENMIRYGG